MLKCLLDNEITVFLFKNLNLIINLNSFRDINKRIILFGSALVALILANSSRAEEYYST